MKNMKSNLKAIRVGILIVAILNVSVARAADDNSFSGMVSGFFSRIANVVTSFFHSDQDQSQTPAPVVDRSSDRPSLQQQQPQPQPSLAPVEPQLQSQAQPQVQPQSQSSPVPQDSSNSADGSSSQGGIISRLFRPYPSNQANQANQDQPSAPRASGPVTRDSSFQASGTVPANARWLMAVIKKTEGGESTAVVPASPGAPLPTVYLSSGPGEYTIKFYASDVVRPQDRPFGFVTQATVRNDDPRDNAFLLPSLAVESNTQDVIELANSVTKNLSTDREKALAIHNWMTGQITYDYDGLYDGTYSARPVDALSVLSSRVTVCQGYSNLYAALMRAAGIRAKIVSGRLYNKGVPSDQSPEQICNAPYDPETNHAWNEVYVDNRWMTVDVTSDAGYSLDNTTAGFQHTPYNHRAFDPSTQYYQRKYVKCSDDTQ